jgi:hypothetical protein
LKPIVIIYNFQTLITGAMALVGAVWTVVTINKQIRQANTLEAERRARKHLVARAMSANSLSSLTAYSEQCLTILSTLASATGTQTIEAVTMDEIPPIPSEALLTLGQCLEFGDEPIRKDIESLIHKLQIQQSRLRSLKSWLGDEDKLVVRSNVLDFKIDALEIYARCAKLFLYSRGQSDFKTGEPTSDDLISAAQNCGFWGDPKICEAIKRRYN